MEQGMPAVHHRLSWNEVECDLERLPGSHGRPHVSEVPD